MENVEIRINGEQFKEFFAMLPLVKAPKIIIHTIDPKSWIEVQNDLSGNKEVKIKLAPVTPKPKPPKPRLAKLNIFW